MHVKALINTFINGDRILQPCASSMVYRCASRRAARVTRRRAHGTGLERMAGTDSGRRPPSWFCSCTDIQYFLLGPEACTLLLFLATMAPGSLPSAGSPPSVVGQSLLAPAPSTKSPDIHTGHSGRTRETMPCPCIRSLSCLSEAPGNPRKRRKFGPGSATPRWLLA